MLYFALALVVSVLTLMAFSEWRKTKVGSTKRCAHLQAEVKQHIAFGHWHDAERILQKIRRNDPITASLHVVILRKTGRHTEAKKVLQETLSQYPKALILIKEQAKLQLEMGDAKAALRSFQRSLRLLRDEEDLTDLASCHYQLGDVIKAWETISSFLKHAPSGRVLALAGDCCFSHNNFTQALSYYRAAQAEGIINQQLLSRMGHCLRRLKKFSDAEHCFNAILDNDSTNVTAILSLGACLEAQGFYARAMMTYQQSGAWGDPRLLRQAGICAVHTERFAYAERYLSDALQRGSKSVQTFAFLAYALERQERWALAEEVYLLLTRAHPEHVAGYRGVAWLFGVGLNNRIDAEQALQMAKESLRLVPDPISWEMLSACEARAGNFDEAHHIQECLVSGEQDRSTLLRRQRAMRNLRKRLPLGEDLVAKALVA